jgi:hypothetical protein
MDGRFHQSSHLEQLLLQLVEFFPEVDQCSPLIAFSLPEPTGGVILGFFSFCAMISKTEEQILNFGGRDSESSSG